MKQRPKKLAKSKASAPARSDVRGRQSAGSPGDVGGYFEGEPLRLGPGPQLVLDDFLVEDRWRLRRELCLPDKHVRNPVLICDRPWEGACVSAVTVFWDESSARFRMWYCPYFPFGELPDGLGRVSVCYAESLDGIHWDKPLFDRYAAGPHLKTNIVYRSACPGDPYALTSQVFRDETDPDPRRRYKMISYESRLVEGKPQRGVNLVVSPDGLEWQIDGGRPLLDYNSDFANHLVRDARTGHWLLYCRPKVMHATGKQWKEMVSAKNPDGRHTSRRLAVMTSPDLETWSYPRTCFYPDERDMPDYDVAAVFPWGSHFIMLYVAMAGDGDGTKECRLASSPDGCMWERFHSREAFIPRGRPGDWDAGQVMRLSPNPPVIQGTDVLIFYTGASKGQFDWHGRGGVGLALTKVDRFAMQYADDEPGFLITKEFILEGNRLRVNSFYRKTKDCVHYLKVEIVRHPRLGRHADEKPVVEGFSLADCEPLKENATDTLITWKENGDLTPLVGQAIYLRFEMRNMGLFAFKITRE